MGDNAGTASIFTIAWRVLVVACPFSDMEPAATATINRFVRAWSPAIDISIDRSDHSSFGRLPRISVLAAGRNLRISWGSCNSSLASELLPIGT